MKKIAKNKLQLDRQTIAVLTASQLDGAAGGRPPNTQNTQCAQEGCTGTHPTQFGLC